MNLRPTNLLTHNNQNIHIKTSLKKKEQIEKQRKLYWFENEEQLNISDFNEYQHFIKTGKEGYEPILNIEEVNPPLLFIDPFLEVDFQLETRMNEKSKYPLYLYEEEEEDWTESFCETVIF